MLITYVRSFKSLANANRFAWGGHRHGQYYIKKRSIIWTTIWLTTYDTTII